jgi:hypothetical protein
VDVEEASEEDFAEIRDQYEEAMGSYSELSPET